MTPKYPNITVQLRGEDGNAVSILMRTAKALRRAGVKEREIERFKTEATSGDYDHLLQTAMAWVEVD